MENRSVSKPMSAKEIRSKDASSSNQKKYVAVTGTRTDARTKEVQTDTTGEPSGIEPVPVESHRELTDEWPDRSQVPSVRDIIVYRKTAREATAKVVAQLTRKRFEWTGTPTITSEQYVQGVVAAYDQARRSIMDDLRRCLEEERTSIVSIRQWIKEQPSPLCPTQCLMIKTAQQKKLLHIYVVLSTVDHNLL